MIFVKTNTSSGDLQPHLGWNNYTHPGDLFYEPNFFEDNNVFL